MGLWSSRNATDHHMDTPFTDYFFYFGVEIFNWIAPSSEKQLLQKPLAV